MALNRKTKLLAFLMVIIIFIVQSVSLVTFDFDGTTLHSQKSNVKIFCHTQNGTSAIHNIVSKKTNFKVPFSRLQFLSDVCFFTLVSIILFSNYNEYFINYRDKIKRYMTNHFHGTKYKGSTFVI